ncbi:YwhD family protein [Halalkalibacterium halodurans]|uniref:BH3813 protein n=2 Tax=Halalkalibacterium halodurans TaxID=86665 RepID=Q9K6B6_HALH5|nr:YwhD family protein [Halalkalibacterium halodurans]MDY7224317.1 YwhD family protein [Halalkalibacterium halodurans]MDY7243602.1 YwhD family protein [Halalkalibacterium halodurans]MED3646469.1 YwhD family protein [Halalkalibacterium halodurans]MED4079522.1 YwhD family protein [Halalkalibacterium halodurans]MED4084201.1 YwhD family protein [Halalkalibacterium halodurans]
MIEVDLLNNDNLKKKTSGFTILSGDSTDGHGGYGAGVLSLDNVTPVFVDPEEERAFVDLGALHARSEVEKRIKFLPNKEEVPNGKLYWLVWVTIDSKKEGPYYAGVAGCEMTVDREIRRGYKSMPEHVNKMDKSIKGKIVVDDMDERSKRILGEYLKSFNEDMWKRSEPELREKLLGEK